MDYSLLINIEKGTTQHVPMRNVFKSEDCTVTYHVGIIDFLQYYNLTKRAEHCNKSGCFNKSKSKGLSCVEPDFYARRFIEFSQKQVFWYSNLVDETSLLSDSFIEEYQRDKYNV